MSSSRKIYLAVFDNLDELEHTVPGPIRDRLIRADRI